MLLRLRYLLLGIAWLLLLNGSETTDITEDWLNPSMCGDKKVNNGKHDSLDVLFFMLFLIVLSLWTDTRTL